MDQGLKK
ncbi:hypothetical protein LINPERPRIM_LOCUS44212 [Linum perenne]